MSPRFWTLWKGVTNRPSLTSTTTLPSPSLALYLPLSYYPLSRLLCLSLLSLLYTPFRSLWTSWRKLLVWPTPTSYVASTLITTKGQVSMCVPGSSGLHVYLVVQRIPECLCFPVITVCDCHIFIFKSYIYHFWREECIFYLELNIHYDTLLRCVYFCFECRLINYTWLCASGGVEIILWCLCNDRYVTAYDHHDWSMESCLGRC